MKEKKVCSVAGCCNPAKTKTFCQVHYARFHRHGDPLGGGTFQKVEVIEKKCRIEGCTNTYKSGRWCFAHYERFKKYGDPLAGGSFKEPNSEKCKIEGCGSPPWRSACVQDTTHCFESTATQTSPSTSGTRTAGTNGMSQRPQATSGAT